MFSAKSFSLAQVGVRGYKKSLVPTLRIMKARQERVGKFQPQRSAVIEWDFNREVNTLCRRFGLSPSASFQDAFITESYVESETANRAKLGLELVPIQSNKALAEEGLKSLKMTLSPQLKQAYPFLPSQAIDALRDYLCSLEVLSEIAKQMGLSPLVLRSGMGLEVDNELLKDTLLAVVACINNPEELCHLNILTHLCGKDVLDIWNPKDVSFMLNSLLHQQKLPEYEARMIFETGRNTLEAVFYVGVYSDKEMMGKGAGVTQSIAIDVAVRDALRRLFRVTRAERSPFERMAIQRLDQQQQLTV